MQIRWGYTLWSVRVSYQNSSCHSCCLYSEYLKYLWSWVPCYSEFLYEIKQIFTRIKFTCCDHAPQHWLCQSWSYLPGFSVYKVFTAALFQYWKCHFLRSVGSIYISWTYISQLDKNIWNFRVNMFTSDCHAERICSYMMTNSGPE